MSEIRILIADDHPVILARLQTIINEQEDMRVVSAASNGGEALETIDRDPVDLALLDIQTPAVNGIEVAQYILDRKLPISVVMLSAYEHEGYLCASLRAGAKGFITKDTSESMILDQIRAVHRGDTIISPGPAKTLVNHYVNNGFIGNADVPRIPDPDFMELLQHLPVCLQDVLDLLIQAKTNTEIATTLRITEGSTKKYVSLILAELQCLNRSEVAVRALNAGYRTSTPGSVTK